MKIAILGSTGSIGIQTLDVISRHPDKFQVYALSANTRVDLLFEQCQRFQPRYVVMGDKSSANLLKQKLGHSSIKVLEGSEALQLIAQLPEIECVVAAIVGVAGFLPTLAAVQAGKRVLLANKESLVIGGEFFVHEAQKSQALILPVDSEHNAIFQCLHPEKKFGAHVNRILLTASGGPFRKVPLEELAHVTPTQAAAHPRWNMGRKVSIDSATLMNKSLEVIEAHWLFGVPPSKIEVLIHPQSIVHSLVEYADGSTLAQLSNPDMRTPIAHALAWPDRIEAGVKPLDLIEIAQLDFESVDRVRYPCLGFAYQVLEKGGTSSAILNAANEVAVQSFCDGQIPFNEIAAVIENVLNEVPHHTGDNLEIILEDDHLAREAAREKIKDMVK